MSGYFKVNNDILDKYGQKLGPMGFTIYSCLIRHNGKNGCFPSHKRISNITGISKRTVIKYIAIIEEIGLVKVKRNKKNNGENEVNNYIFISKTGSATDTLGSATDALGSANERNRVVRQMHTNKTKDNKTNITSQRNKFSDDDMTLAEFIFSKILQMNPKEKKPDFKKWADTIRLTREIDKRGHKEIQDIFIWANNDHFWRSNIRSPSKLRKKLTELEDKMKSLKGEGYAESRNIEAERSKNRAINFINGVQSGVCETVGRAGTNIQMPKLSYENG